jgi:hypothetical protein
MAKRRKAPKRRKARRVTRRRKVRRTSRGAAAPLVAQMAAYRDRLLTQQAGLQAEIDKLTEAMSTLGGTTTRRKAARRARPGPRRGAAGVRAGSLKDFILKAMRPGQVMAVKDIAAAVQRRGYTTKSHNFPNQVSNALAQIANVKKVSRGKFRL